MSKSQLDVLKGLNLIKGDDRPHYLADTQATLDEAEAELPEDEGDETALDIEAEPEPAAVAQVDELVASRNRILELEAYIDQRVEIHAATRQELIKQSGELVTLRGSLKHYKTLLTRAKKHIERLNDQQAMSDDENDEDCRLLLASLEGAGL